MKPLVIKQSWIRKGLWLGFTLIYAWQIYLQIDFLLGDKRLQEYFKLGYFIMHIMILMGGSATFIILLIKYLRKNAYNIKRFRKKFIIIEKD